MWRGRRAGVATIGAYTVGAGNLIFLVFDAHTTVTLSLTIMLAPCTLVMALQLTAFLACGVLSLVLGDARDRAVMLAQAIGGMQLTSEGEQYTEAMVAVIRVAPADQARAIATNLIIAAPRTILAAWGRIPRPLWDRARKTVGASAGRPGS